MIEIFQGRIGGGKTFTAVERACERVAAGGTVYSNIDFLSEGVERYLAIKYGCAFDQDLIQPLPDDVFGWHKQIRWGTFGEPVLVIIDEAHLWYNSRDWKRTQDEHSDMLSFLTQSRKAHVDVIFISQVATNIDKQFRMLAQYTWELRDLARVNFPFVGVLLGSFIFYSQRDYDGVVLKQGLRFKSKLIYKAYDSFAFLDPEMARQAEEERERAITARVVRKVSPWQRLKFYLNMYD